MIDTLFRKYNNHLLVILDNISIIVAFFITYQLRNVGFFRMFLDQVQPLAVYLTALPYGILLFIVIGISQKLYTTALVRKPFAEWMTAIRTTLYWGGSIMIVSYLIKYDYSRIIVLLTIVNTLSLAVIVRWLFRLIRLRVLKHEDQLRVLIVGAGRRGRDLARKLVTYEGLRYTVAGFIDDFATGKKQYPVVGKLASLDKLIKQLNIHEVYVTDSTLSYETILTTIASCSHLPIRFHIAENIFSVVGVALNAEAIDQFPTLDLEKLRNNRIRDGIKRLFDLITASMLLVITFPLWIVIVLGIRLKDSTPVLFTQKRIGRGGVHFTIYKFRTMQQGKKNTIIPGIGNFLRRTSLDELPQLINILQGDMSMVGPRPELPEKVVGYTAWQKLRLETKPGLTGLWQILGRKDLPLEKNIEYDLYYVANQSLVFDILILLRTLPVVISGRGAY